MRKIYLASNSKARKKILGEFGLKFKVLPSKANEKRKPCGLNYARLVKDNALMKAKDVAKRIPHGIVIGADTIVVQGRKIFGKPKDLKHARRMLKRLSSKPQWLYTAVALVDKDNDRSLVDYEKTKIFMDKLNDKEINAYFSCVSPLDKAGSFDIQGKGAFFIRRIEGCFYNVVGLPLRKLYRMLKELDVKVFLLFLLFNFSFLLFISGCSTEYNVVTGEQETYFYSSDKEEQMGRSIAKEIEKENKLADDPLYQKRVEDIGKKIIKVCDRKDIDYTFKVLDDEEINAVSLPGGVIYVNKGLIDKCANDDELAGVISHEVGHIVARHHIKKLQAAQAFSILRILVAASPQAGDVGTAADIAFNEFLTGYGREDELLADQLSVRYMKLAGYDPKAMVDFLLKLQEVSKRRPLRPRNYYKTHPYVPDRIRVVKQEMGEKIGFNDYINIEQKPHDVE